MNLNKEIVKQIVLKILADLKIDYFKEDEIEIVNESNVKTLWKGVVLSNAWTISIGIPDFQFGDPLGTSIIIIIDDATGEVKNYIEGPGRPVPSTMVNNEDGNYEIAPII